ncbi:2-phosphoglycerate kinase [Bacillus sp. SA1-12]|uniref:zeta toxin family protein n=1 Tax=Bacillus sp. SA1-12 TaxID=1455638 RepID=UPI0006271C1B|nr:2-phosphoglycerate kinase [Bacillus sp. SA1-12]KKI91190.1 2-phosphoglycerate kinase [Bacillus sp. SA1-12]
MIILISGNGQSGKTFMAQHLLEKYKVPYLSIDHLKMGIYRSDKNCGFTPLDSSELIGDKLWPIIREIIKTNIENNQNLIIEGCYILPHYIKEFEKFYAEKIISVFLVFSTQYIKANFESKILKHRNVIEDRGELDADFNITENITENIKEHNQYRRRCIEAGYKYFEIDKNYEEEITKVYDYIETQKRIIESK